MLFRSLLKPLTTVALLVGLGAYATIMLRGPKGVSALAEKHRQIQRLQEENADLQRDINAKQHRIEQLQHDPGTQELEVRKRMKMQREGETKFVLPDAPAAADHPQP